MKPFKLNDPVTNTKHGFGVVISIDNDNLYPIVVRFDNKSEETFTVDGKYVDSDHTATLIHGHHANIKIVPVRQKSVKPKDSK